MDLWKLNGHRSWNNDLEPAEGMLSDQGKLNDQSTQYSALACAEGLWSE
jgi:hypothetical protein